MRKKCNVLALCSFIIAAAIFVLTYFLFHYIGPDGTILTVSQKTPGKPFVTLLFGIWGVAFLFSSVMSILVGKIFFDKE